MQAKQIMQAKHMSALACLSLLVATPALAGFGESQQERLSRWKDLRTALFAGRTTTPDGAAVKLEAPSLVLDAALVPLAIELADPTNVKALYIVVDDNPSPLAAHFVFGPDIDPAKIQLRLRIDTYTNIHAVAEMNDGRLLETSTFVKASGGCSAPMGMSDEEAMAGMGDIRIKNAGTIVPDRPTLTTLMIRHPNFNGMQMNQDNHGYEPARYIQTVAVTFSGKKVFDLSTDISLASNPVISFSLKPDRPSGPLEVDVQDSQTGRWSRTFELRAVGN